MTRRPRGGGSPVDGLQGAYAPSADTPINNQQDPLGIGLRQRSVASENANVNAMPFGSDPMNIEHQAAIQSLVNASSDPQGFDTMLQGWKEGDVGAVKAGPSAPGSQQLVGQSVQPDATTDPVYNGRVNRGYRSTLFDPQQTSAVTGMNYGQDQQFQQALAGLKGRL